MGIKNFLRGKPIVPSADDRAKAREAAQDIRRKAQEKYALGKFGLKPDIRS